MSTANFQHPTRRHPIRWILVGLVAVVFVVWRITVAIIGPKLEIGPETTVVTGPRTPAGLIDYVAAMHERMSLGVKPEDNGAVLFDRAFGPGKISPELRARYFEWMKTGPLPEQGNYMLTQSALMEKKLAGINSKPDLKDAMFKEFSRTQSQPWIRADCPLVAEWLDANAGPLELIEQATQRSQYYSPLVSNGGFLLAETTVQSLREAARLLSTRAMLRLGEDDVAGAWSDLRTCHHLAALTSQRAPRLIEFLVSVAVESMASHKDAVLIAHGLSAEQARKCLAEHAQLRSFADFADILDQGERLQTLDSILLQLSPFVDVNMMLRRTNQFYGELIAALKLKNRDDRDQAIATIEAEMTQRSAAAGKPFRLAVSVLTGSRRAVTESVGGTLLALLTPAVTQGDVAQMRVIVHRDQVRIGFALAAYHAEQGTYPQTLAELIPKYLGAIPLDRFTDKPLVYIPRENGFLIYSLGANGKDDGGRMGGNSKPDDIPFEVPPKFDD